jgi:hypothetical protein
MIGFALAGSFIIFARSAGSISCFAVQGSVSVWNEKLLQAKAIPANAIKNAKVIFVLFMG